MKSITLLSLLSLAPLAACDCSSGYTVNSTASEHFAVFTEILETDFLHVPHTQSDDWIPQAYNVTPEAARGPYGKAAQVENVITNVISSPWDWSGLGVEGPNPGLQLWNRAGLVDVPGTSERMVPMAEIVSARNDVLYGSFRVGIMTTDVKGTCAAFFFYRSDSQEIDMEFLSKQEQRDAETGVVNLVIQVPASAELGHVDHTSPDFSEHGLRFSTGEGYNEYRFDWLADRVEFYANGDLLYSTTENVPREAGSIHLIHWSNGDAGWSGGPPEEDAVVIVSYVKAYFNSSNPDMTKRFLSKCQKIGESCEIPNQEVAPDVLGAKRNKTGKTFFFTDQNSDQDSGPGHVVPSDAGNPSISPSERLSDMIGTYLVHSLTRASCQSQARRALGHVAQAKSIR